MRRNTEKVRWHLLLLFLGLILGSCTKDSNEEDSNEGDILDPKDEVSNPILDSDAKGDCKTIKMGITSGEIEETYQIEYNAQGKITQAIGSNGKYTFSHSPNSYFYSNYNAMDHLTNTKEVQLNSEGKVFSYIEKKYGDNGKVDREEEGTLTYSNGKISELKITLDDAPIKVYTIFWKNGNISEIESAGYIDRKYEYYTEHTYPKDGLMGIDLIGYLQTGIYYMGHNANLLKHSEVDGVIADFSYNFNEHGKIVSQENRQNNLSDPVYFTPTYSCK